MIAKDKKRFSLFLEDVDVVSPPRGLEKLSGNGIEKQAKVEKSSAEFDDYPEDPHSDDLYDWIDNQFLRAGLQIGGKQPYGTKIVGRGIELQLYQSLSQAVEDYLKTLAGDESQIEVLSAIKDLISSWAARNMKPADEAFEELFRRGFDAGTVSTGKMGTFDEQAMNVIKEGKYRIGNRIRLFADDAIKDFAKIITEAYTPEGTFSLQSLADKMQAAVPAQRYKIERVARTEVNQVSNVGRIFGWAADPDRYYWDYYWNHSADAKVRPMKRWRAERNPWSLKEIVFLWTHNDQLMDGRFQQGSINCRCTVSRSPREDENIDNRLEGQEGNFRRTFDFEIPLD